jgi:hypothetical protein
MGFLVLNGSNDSLPLVPMQRSGRKVQLAAISSNKVGKAIQVRSSVLSSAGACLFFFCE